MNLESEVEKEFAVLQPVSLPVSLDTINNETNNPECVQATQSKDIIKKKVNKKINNVTVDEAMIQMWRENFNNKILNKYLNKNNPNVKKEDKVSSNSQTLLRAEVTEILKVINNEPDHGVEKSKANRIKNRGFVINQGKYKTKE